jgi:hypothetical protein
VARSARFSISSVQAWCHGKSRAVILGHLIGVAAAVVVLLYVLTPCEGVEADPWQHDETGRKAQVLPDPIQTSPTLWTTVAPHKLGFATGAHEQTVGALLQSLKAEGVRALAKFELDLGDEHTISVTPD